MTHKILIPVRGDGKGDKTLAYAASLAGGGDNHIVIVHCRPSPEDMLPYGIPLPKILRKQILEQASTLADVEEKSLITELKVLAKSLNLNLSGTAIDGMINAEWVEETGRQVDVIRRQGRLADIIVVPQPDVDRNLGTNTLKAALFHSGRPVLMVPNDGPLQPLSQLGRNVTIAWNGSLESSRAVTMTLPLLQRTNAVTILSSGAEPNAASARDLKSYLLSHRVEATIERFEKTRNVGEKLLSLTADLGADTLIMGAYGDSHERETVFGGNTQHIVDKAKMPVILVH
ncbi:MAG: universal stress protein [Proteobacteria bacterium]|nr:universal stress protein [Pseudomonadota bacterium]